MDSGVIGRIVSGRGELEEFTNTIPVNDERVNELNQCVTISQDARLPDGRAAQFGQAAIEDIGEEDTTRILGNEITTSTEYKKVVKSTHFLFVPGSFMCVESSSGQFAFDLISRHTGNEVKRVEFDIDGYVEDAHREGVDPWKVGFYENHGRADNGVIHGEDLLSDPEFEAVFKQSKKNQIGLEYSEEGKRYKNFVTESGYVNVYQPSDLSSGDFAEYVESELLHHSYLP